MARLKDAHPLLRPREKLIRYGVERLSNTELLALLLRSGKKNISAVELAEKIFKVFTAENLPEASIDRLTEVDGVGIAKASEIIASFELSRRLLHEKKSTLILTPEDVFDELRDIRDSKKEHFVTIFLDVRNQKIKKEIISIGILDTNIIHPREVFEPAIKHLAAQMIIAHNHPSQDPSPSDEDISTTKRLVTAGKLLGLDIIDHVIVTKNSYFSFKHEGVMDTI